MTLHFDGQLDFVWALLPEIVLTTWAIVVLVVGAARPADRDGSDLGWLSLFGILATAALNGWLYGVAEAGATGMVAVDGFRLFSNWIFLLSGALTILVSFGYVRKQRLQAAEFYGLMLLSIVGMMFMASSRDLILTFLALEVMSIAVYALSAINRRDRRSAEAGLKYFLLGAFASAFFLYGIALVYGATGSTNIALVAIAVEAGAVQPTLMVAGILLLVVGFGFKASLVPFHMWTPDVYEGSPSPVTAFMSAGVKAAAFVAFLRVFFVAFPGLSEVWVPVLWWLAAVSMVGANVMALSQENVKRMLAYSSVAHAGYLLVALVALNDRAVAGLLFYLLVYTFMNIGAFAVLMTVSHHGEERLHVEDYAGFGWQQPVLGVLMTIFLLSLAGFPGTGGFMAKVYLLLAAGDAALWSLAVVLVLTTVASYWYYLRVAYFMWMRDARSADAHTGVVAPMALRFALVACAGILLITGLFPGATLEFARASAEGLTAAGLARLGLHP